MRLTNEEQAMLAGEFGPGVQKAIEIVVALGKIYGAEDLVPVTSVQVSGVSYKNLGEAGLEFLQDWADQGGKVRVPTTLNPAGLDLARWAELGFSADFALKQDLVIQAFKAMQIQPTCTCTPYLVGNQPGFGEHLAWAESSAVSFANSVLGARTNREGGPSALAAAITGRTARYGLHLPANRRAQLVVDVQCPILTPADFGALGVMVGKKARNRIPYFRNLAVPSPIADYLKALGSAMAASGAVALYHIEGVTPEADLPEQIGDKAEGIQITTLQEGFANLNSTTNEKIDLVWIGCPHASLAELRHVISLLAGRPIKANLWITMAREVRAEAEKRGLVAELASLGGQVVADTCLVVAPIEELGFQTVATPSGKGAYYIPSHTGLAVRYGSLEACIEAAVKGCWCKNCES